MKKFFVLGSVLMFLVACAGTPQEKAANKMLEMQKEKRELIDKGVVAGLGIGESASEQMAYDEADLNARTDAARMLESKVEALFRNYQEEVGNELTEHQETVRKNVISGIQSGVSVVKMDIETTDGKYKVYAIAAMDAKLIQKAFEDELKARQANVERAKAMTGYKELEKEAKALDEYKAKQAK